jgi:large subunit ribosomal protein L22
MEGKAIINNIGKSAKKMRIPSEVVRGMNVYDALNVLKFMNKGTAVHMYKALKSAAANASNKGASLNDLYIKELRVDKGAIRIRKGHPKAKGAGYFMMNRGVTNLIVVVSDERVEKKTEETKEKTVKTDKKVTAEKSVKKASVKGKSSSK